MSRKFAVLPAVACAVAAGVVAAPAASAATRVQPEVSKACSVGSHRLAWSSVKKTWVITHATVLENYTGGVATKEFTAEKVNEVSASASATEGEKLSANVIIADLEGNVELSLQLAGSHTSTHSETISYQLSKNGTYVIYSGTKKVTGNYTRYKCVSTKTDILPHWVKNGQRGTAKSWTTKVEGGVRCNAKVPKSSLAAAAKKKYC
jgi:hypothetical protein